MYCSVYTQYNFYFIPKSISSSWYIFVGMLHISGLLAWKLLCSLKINGTSKKVIVDVSVYGSRPGQDYMLYLNNAVSTAAQRVWNCVNIEAKDRMFTSGTQLDRSGICKPHGNKTWLKATSQLFKKRMLYLSLINYILHSVQLQICPKK